MICKKCGERTEEQFDFCTECGEVKEEQKESEIETSEEDASESDIAESKSTPKASTKAEGIEKKPEEVESEFSKKRMWLNIGCVALLVFLLVMASIDSRNIQERRYAENEVAADVEFEFDQEEEEELVEEIYIPEGALTNDYIAILQHKGLELMGFDTPEITDEDVERIIQMKLDEQSTLEEVTDRPAEDGDWVVIDFAGSVDGEYFPGGTSEGFELHLGSGTFIGPYGDYEGFEEQIIGHSIGDNFDITIQFPSVYHSPELAGEVANFNITIHAITETITPEFTDEWVQENSSQSTTVEEFHQEVKEELIGRTRINTLFIQQQGVFEALMEQVIEIDIPDWAIENETLRIHDLYRNLAAAEGMEFEDFLRFNFGMDEAMFNQEVIRVSVETAPRTLAMHLIMESENIELTQEEITEWTEELARFSEMDSAEEFIEILGEKHVLATIVQLRVAEFLIEHSHFIW